MKREVIPNNSSHLSTLLNREKLCRWELILKSSTQFFAWVPYTPKLPSGWSSPVTWSFISPKCIQKLKSQLKTDYDSFGFRVMFRVYHLIRKVGKSCSIRNWEYDMSGNQEIGRSAVLKYRINDIQWWPYFTPNLPLLIEELKNVYCFWPLHLCKLLRVVV